MLQTLHHRSFDPAALTAAKRARRLSVSVCLPARDESGTIGRIVSSIRRNLVETHALVDEILVVDDGSADDTMAGAARAGARVVAAADVLAECGPGQGKGEALWKSLHAAAGDLVLWCDADISNFGPRFVTGLLGPLLGSEEVGFVKGFYDRPLDGRPGQGGRVTELVARPLISMLFPHLSSVVQPLSGEYGGRREVLERVPFVQGYGVDLALLVDVASAIGLGDMAQVDLGVRVHRNRPLEELGPQAMAILQTALDRAGVLWRPEWSHVLVRPGLEPAPVPCRERPPMIEVPAYRRTA
ncbi:MAG: glucosyl-3-phosphoglycerate synthase [Acidimicrobiales bacterium]